MVPIKNVCFHYHHHITNHFAIADDDSTTVAISLPLPAIPVLPFQRVFACDFTFYCLFYYTNTVFAFIHTYFIWLTRHHHKIQSLCLFHDDSIGKTNHAGEYGPTDGSNKDVWKAYNRPYLKFNLEDLWGGL